MSLPSSPRMRRLQNDYKSLLALQNESTIFRFYPLDLDPLSSIGKRYILEFHGRGLYLQNEDQPPTYGDRHEVAVHLSSTYPRTVPEIRWKTPIFHPNISANGYVCLGGLGTHWVPSLGLADLCEMLWNMLRFENYDIESPYNKQAAQWVNEDFLRTCPLDLRPLRNLSRTQNKLVPDENLDHQSIGVRAKNTDTSSGSPFVEPSIPSTSSTPIVPQPHMPQKAIPVATPVAEVIFTDEIPQAISASPSIEHNSPPTAEIIFIE
ncbi:MAG: hypothetical protein MPJ24_06790 [Pirellulaceae bacterium]|nr:hypothetical protein [Pirellulaceae bacterium]